MESECVHNSLTLVHILNQINPIHTIPSCLLTISIKCNIINRLTSSFSWDVSNFATLRVSPRFGGTCRPPSSGLSGARNQHEPGSKQSYTYRHVPGDRTFHNHRCESLKSYIKLYGLVVTVLWQRIGLLVLHFWIIMFIQGVCPGPRFLWSFVTTLFFYGEELLVPCPNPKMEDHLLSAVRDC
jgi:hypothetical protein